MTSIAELRRLEAFVDQGEWTYSPSAERVFVRRPDGLLIEVCHVSDDDFAALIVAMRNALPELLKALEWQPIETAPKDTKILVGYRNSLGNWRTVTACYHTQLPWSEDAWRDDDDESEYAPEGWYEESETHENILPLEHGPVAWKPLPHGGVDVG